MPCKCVAVGWAMPLHIKNSLQGSKANYFSYADFVNEDLLMEKNDPTQVQTFGSESNREKFIHMKADDVLY